MRLALAALLACGCQGAVGTIDVDIVTSPGSTVMDDVQRIRLTLTSPEKVVEADRVGDRFDLELEVSAEGQNGAVLIEGFDGDGNLIASGASAPLPVAAIDATVKIFVAPPVSIQAAPVTLSAPRSEMAATRLSFGVLYAGGRDASGEPTDDLVIYNVYDHDFQSGDSMPDPLTGVSAMTASGGQVFLFGGEDAGGVATADAYRFDTNIAPAGAYFPLATDDSLARSFANAAPIDNDAFVVLGDPVALVDGVSGRVQSLSDQPLDGVATSVLVFGFAQTLVTGDGAGQTGASIIMGGTPAELTEAPTEVDRTDHAHALLADLDVLVVGGQTAGGLAASGVRFDFAERSFTVIDDLLATPRLDPAVAANDRYVVVAGGTNAAGNVVGDAEIFDASTLEPVATVPLLVPRTGATAHRLPNGQIIIAGGVDAAGAPTDVIELFTP